MNLGIFSTTPLASMEDWLFIYLFMHFFLYKSLMFIYVINRWMKYSEYLIIISFKFLFLSLNIYLSSLTFSLFLLIFLLYISRILLFFLSLSPSLSQTWIHTFLKQNNVPGSWQKHETISLENDQFQDTITCWLEIFLQILILTKREKY